MKQKVTLLVMILFFILLAACDDAGSDPDYGMNEITFEQMEGMFENRESFLLLTYDMDEEFVESWQIIESFDESLNRTGLKGFYTNLHGMSEDQMQSLEERYISSRSSNWEADRDGLVLVEYGAVVTERTASVSERLIERWVFNEWFEPNSELSQGWFDDDINEIMQVIQLLNVELTHQ